MSEACISITVLQAVVGLGMVAAAMARKRKQGSELQASVFFPALFSMASHNRPTSRGQTALQSTVLFLFSVMIWRLFTMNKAGFPEAGYLKAVYYQNRSPEGLE